jgi:hypothetical protein
VNHDSNKNQTQTAAAQAAVTAIAGFAGHPDQASFKVLTKTGCILFIALLLLAGCETYKKIPGHPNGMSLGVSHDPNGGTPQIYETLNWNFD